ncbi:carbon-nitrogen hydrolase family protein [Oceaniserpentilla sp. 4NH20-0058]|uniref:carbon-nitrogen hydrolase family protein n=1 Tax=Oceaniserpentilla sp. 4NH20-0058 TaxID=3127660 RepID=UPI00310303D8
MRAAVIQMNSGRDVDGNLTAAHQLLTEASSQGVKLAVLPEMFACIGVKNQFSLAQERFIEQDVLGVIATWARQFDMYIVAGSMPLMSDSYNEAEKVLAACLVFSPDGRLLEQYNKIHLFDVDVSDEKGRYRESDTFLCGENPKVIDIHGHKLGLSICYDLRFPELYQVYQNQECELITVPSAFTYETGRIHWEILLRGRAIETQSFVLAANQVGVHEDGRRTWGQSMIIGPNGEVLAQADNETVQVVIADLDFSALEQCRQKMPITQHKKIILGNKS